MKSAKILIIGGGIGGLTAAIALRQRHFEVDLLEKNPAMTVYGVGIIQQANVIRAFSQLGILDAYVNAGFGFDSISVFAESGELMAKLPTPRLVAGYPANLGISRRSLHELLTDTAARVGARLEFGITTTALEQSDAGVTAHFEGREPRRYDLVVAADGINSVTRKWLFPQAMEPEFTGQSVWRYNLTRDDAVDGIWVYSGAISVGLVPLSQTVMYMYITTPEPNDARPPREELARSMTERLSHSCASIKALGSQITDDEGVVYRPLEWLFLRGSWHKERVVLIGDAAHATTPHLGQGAGMAIEDALVLAEELSNAASIEQAFSAYRARRYSRCEYIVEQSKAICFGQLGKGPLLDPAYATRAMFDVIAKPI